MAEKVKLDEFLYFAFIDPEIKTRQQIAEKTGLKIGSVSDRIRKIRKKMESAGHDEDLRSLPIR